jgi:hypothetical protein
VNANQTGCRTLDKIGADPRVREIYRQRDEGRGPWTYTLVPVFGWRGEAYGAHAIVESNVRDVVRAFAGMVPCECKECREELAKT